MTTVPETDENGTNHFNDDLDKIAEKEAAEEPEKVPAPKVSPAITENKESGDDESGLDDSSDDDAINVVTDPQQAQVSLFPKQTSSMEQVLGAQVQAQAPKVPEGGKRLMIQQGKAPPVSMQGDSSKSVYDADMVDEDKPWLRPGENISDYFNYGFDENTWKIYCERQRMIRAGLDPLSGKAVAPRKPKMQYFSTPSAPQGITTLDAQSAQNIAAQQALEAMMKGQAPPSLPSMPGMPPMPSLGMQLPAGLDMTKLPPMPAGMNLSHLTNLQPQSSQSYEKPERRDRKFDGNGERIKREARSPSRRNRSPDRRRDDRSYKRKYDDRDDRYDDRYERRRYR